MDGWTNIRTQSPPEREPVLLTNNIGARDAHGNMSHLWLAFPFRSREGGHDWIAFDNGYGKIEGITHWMRLPEMARVKETP